VIVPNRNRGQGRPRSTRTWASRKKVRSELNAVPLRGGRGNTLPAEMALIISPRGKKGVSRGEPQKRVYGAEKEARGERKARCMSATEGEKPSSLWGKARPGAPRARGVGKKTCPELIEKEEGDARNSRRGGVKSLYLTKGKPSVLSWGVLRGKRGR